MDDTCATLFSWLDTDGCQDEVSMSLTSARSDCAVSGVVLRGTQRASSPRPYHDQRVVCFMLVRHVERHKEKLDWNNTSA